MKLIDEIRIRCEEKLQEAQVQSNQQLIERYTIIDSFLINDRCFIYITRQEAVVILGMLGYSEDESHNIYNKLTEYDNIKGIFKFDDGGMHI